MSAAGRALVFVLLCGFGLAQGPSIPVANPATGSVSAGVYTNNFFRISYHLPAQWITQNSANPFLAKNDYREEAGVPDIHESDGKKYLLMSAGETGTDSSVEVVAYDVSGQPTISANDVAIAELGALHSLGGKMQAIARQTIAGRIFSVGRAEINGDVQGRREPVYAGVAAVKEGNFVLTWSFFANSQAQLDQLLTTLDTINFEK